MSSRTKKIVTFVVRWGIAVAGIGWVLSNISLNDRVLIADPLTGRPTPAKLAEPAGDNSNTYQIISPTDGTTRTVSRDQLFVKSDLSKVAIYDRAGSSAASADRTVEVLGLKVIEGADQTMWPLLVAKPRALWQKYTGTNSGDKPELIAPSQLTAPYSIRVPYPIVETGIGPMTRQAMQDKPLFLLAAIFVFPITVLITSFRWNMLLECLDIQLGIARAFTLNMVGAFYNTFMPGSTGGDVLKAYYAAKQTPHRTRAVVSVIVDRVLGLLALVLMGGSAAAYQYFTSPVHDPATRKCGQVVLGSAFIYSCTIVGLLVLYNPLLRRITGFNFIIRRLPMQARIQKMLDTMELYRKHWLVVLWSCLITIPVHSTVVLSAMFAGIAFGLPMHWPYYWVAVPVIVLSGSIPISPQGAGVMEFFAILLTRTQGVTISQAFALTMSIRMVQILWNLVGGLFVARGGFHVPTNAETASMNSDVSEVPAAI